MLSGDVNTSSKTHDLLIIFNFCRMLQVNKRKNIFQLCLPVMPSPALQLVWQDSQITLDMQKTSSVFKVWENAVQESDISK